MIGINAAKDDEITCGFHISFHVKSAPPVSAARAPAFLFYVHLSGRIGQYFVAIRPRLTRVACHVSMTSFRSTGYFASNFSPFQHLLSATSTPLAPISDPPIRSDTPLFAIYSLPSGVPSNPTTPSHLLYRRSLQRGSAPSAISSFWAKTA